MSESKTRLLLEQEGIVAEACGNCRFGLREGKNVTCRRYPPTMLVAESIAAPDQRRGGIVTVLSGVNGHFPTMLANDGWCGEWQSQARDWKTN